MKEDIVELVVGGTLGHGKNWAQVKIREGRKALLVGSRG